jgi:ABC-type branched-subunit amino acid transport system substrate-binding protein
MRIRQRLLVGLLLAGTIAMSSGGVALASVSNQKTSFTVEAINPSPGFGLDWTLGQRGFWDRINAAGGVDGHQINFTTCSDGTFVAQTQDLSATCAEQAVSAHVLAVVGSQSDYDNVVYPILSAAKIADIGSFPDDTADNTSLESTPFLTPTIVLEAGLGIELKQLGHCTKVAILNVAGSAVTQSEDDAFAAGARWAGMKVAAPENLSATVSDYAPTVAILQSAGVDCIADGLSTTGNLPALLTAITDSGKKMTVDFVGVGVTSAQMQAIGPVANNLLADVAGEDDALVNLVQPAKTTPQERLMISDFGRASSAAAANGNLDMPGWVGADVLDIELKRMIAQKLPLTSANVLVALRQNYTITTGVMPPANFSSPGLIHGYNRIHNTYVNYIKIVNYQQQPYYYKLHDTAAALAHFNG